MTDVRFAQSADIPGLVELAHRIHAESRYAWMAFSADRVWTSLESAIDRKDHCLIVANEGTTEAGELVGLLCAHAQAFHFTREIAAQVDCLYVVPKRRGSPAAMKMLAGLRRWASNRQAAEIVVPNTFGKDEAYVGRLITKLGMVRAGGVHSMWLGRS